MTYSSRTDDDDKMMHDSGWQGVASPSSANTYPGRAASPAPSPAPSTQRQMVVANSADYGSDYGGSTGRDVQLTSQQKETLARVLISAEVIEKCGFSLATNINKLVLLEVLKDMKPEGQTALRDAIAVGAAKMLKLKVVLAQLGVVGHQLRIH